MKKTNKKGFTIVELVIVIAVIAILAAVLIPNISRLVKKANESSDIQAVRNMNTFLAAESVTGNINSILDVYDLFADSGYNVDSYSPLYSGRHFYYDKQYNQILYVDTETNKVLFPEEHKNELQNDHDWFSLSMEAPEPEKPADYPTDNKTDVVVTVSSASEYAYVVQKYNEGKITNLTLTLNRDIDMMGANCVIKEAKGTITIKSADSNTFKIKNVTANVEVDQEVVRNGAGIKADYYGGGLVSKLDGSSKLKVENVTFENINVKVPTAGQVGILVGVVQGENAALELNNVTIRNSSVIGHRDVGAIVGASQNGAPITLKGNIKVENTKVMTTGGRSALLIGKIDVESGKAKLNTTGLNLTVTGSTLSIYEDSSLKQKFVISLSGLTPTETKAIAGQTQYIYSYKGIKDGKDAYSAYGYRADALVLKAKSTGDWEAITDLAEFEKGIN